MTSPRIFKPVIEAKPIPSNIESLISAATTLAQKFFVKGHDTNKQFRKRLMQTLEMLKDIRIDEETLKIIAEEKYDLEYFLPRFPQYKSDEFPHIDATRIPGTHMIAAAGPQASADAATFFGDTVFNKTKSIKEFVLLVDCMGFADNVRHTDCIGYCVQPMDEKQEDKKFGPYRVEVKPISGGYYLCLNGVQLHTYDPVVKTEMTIYDDSHESKDAKTVHATIINLSDNTPIVLQLDNEYKESDSENAKEKGDNLKATLWAIYQQSLNEDILIHCASGVGRTGHLIFTFELLKLFTDPNFFVENTMPKMISDKVLGTVDRIREKRPALIFTDAQFTQAIRNAYVLQQYALEHKLLIDKSVSEERKPTATI